MSLVITVIDTWRSCPRICRILRARTRLANTDENAITVVNAGVTLLSDDGTWSATVECKNCADEEYITSFLFGPYWTEPMTWQARFRYNFGAR